MKKFVLLLCLTLLALTVVGGVVAQEESPLPAFADLEAGVWTNIATGGATICSNGTPYSFFARPADEPSNKLLIHFQGGGACWFGEICDLTVNPTYDPFVDESDDPTAVDGIFNFTNEENPFADYNMIMVPYCTGDVHIGNAVTTYTVESTGTEVTINHNGFTNATTVLEWVFGNIIEPETVFVTGCSAGSIPSPLYTQFVGEAYPEARIEQLGDAAGSYRNPALAALLWDAWGIGEALPESYEGITAENFTFESMYVVSATLFPEVSFSQYNAAFDGVQTGFNQLGGLTDFALKDLLDANFADINNAVDNFDSFTVGGDTHCVTLSPEFYTFAAEGVRLVDWVAALAAGEEVDTVSCTECEEVEVIEMEAAGG